METAPALHHSLFSHLFASQLTPPRLPLTRSTPHEAYPLALQLCIGISYSSVHCTRLFQQHRRLKVVSVGSISVRRFVVVVLRHLRACSVAAMLLSAFSIARSPSGDMKEKTSVQTYHSSPLDLHVTITFVSHSGSPWRVRAEASSVSAAAVDEYVANSSDAL